MIKSVRNYVTHFETLLQDDKKGQVRDRVYIKVGRQVSRRVSDQVYWRVRDQVWVQVDKQVWGKPHIQIWEELNDPL
jgi:hypothetical protein